MHLDPAGAGRVSAARLQDPAADVGQHPADRQVPAVYVHHEHRHDRHHGRHHQLELQDAADAPDAALDPGDLPRRAAARHHDDAAVARVPLVPDAANSLSNGHFVRQSSTGARDRRPFFFDNDSFSGPGPILRNQLSSAQIL